MLNLSTWKSFFISSGNFNDIDNFYFNIEYYLLSVQIVAGVAVERYLTPQKILVLEREEKNSVTVIK